ncbi:polysaccharide deacetylase family protein [Teredinibacter franksiae]|uniref:polysaccharide deacetylase family protein n=1 Tax=Teredinibacter franksiae TaxID=2761453 RepID=UPI00162489CF|nr:polysaccharide deacetylase family protein [Teredinibacter franksiae]
MNYLKQVVKQLLTVLKGTLLFRYNIRKHDHLWVIMYHRVLPKNSPAYAREEPGMVVCPEALEQHLELFKKHFEIVDIDSLSDLQPNSNTGKPRLIVTFDDGWADNFQYAFPLLKKHNVPACIYLVTDMIGTNRAFWPNIISKCVHNGWTNQLVGAFDIRPQTNTKIPTREHAAHLIQQIKTLPDTEIWSILSANGWDTAADDDDRLLNWDEVDAMHSSKLITFGSHTCNHFRLTSGLPENVVVHELTESASILEKRFGAPCLHFCYPNGDSSHIAEKGVENIYRTAVTTEKGINSPASNNLRLKRIGVFDDATKTPLHLRARLNG